MPETWGGTSTGASYNRCYSGASGHPTNGTTEFWRIWLASGRDRPPFKSLKVEAPQLGRHSGVDGDGFEGDLVPGFTSGTGWGQARASET